MNRSAWLCILLVALVVPAEAAQAKHRKPAAKKPAAAEPQPEPASGVGGPSSDQPERVLTLWSDGPAVEWRAQAAALYAQAEQAQAALEELGTGGGLKNKFAQIGRIHVALLQLDRLTGLLRIWAEPAAIDLHQRSGDLRDRLDKLAGEILGVQEAAIQANLPKYKARCLKHAKTLRQVERLREQGKLEEAELQIQKVHDELAVEGVWYRWLSKSSPLSPYEDLLKKVSTELVPARRQAAIDAINRARELEKPNYGALLADVDTARAAVAVGQKFAPDGQHLDGPQVVELFLNRWTDVYFKMLHSSALNWVFMEANGSGTDGTIIGNYQQFEENFLAAIVKLIDADADQIGPDNVLERYLAYQNVLAPALARLADVAQIQAFQAALERMAQKSPPTAADVSAYRLATSAALRWRAQVSVAHAARAKRSKPPADLVALRPKLKGTYPETIRELSDKRLGQPVIGNNFVGAPSPHRATSGFDAQQAYCVVRLDDRVKAVSAALRPLLLAGDAQSPLTLEAAMALAGAEQGDLIEACGSITRLEYQGQIPLFAHASPADWGLARFGGSINSEPFNAIHRLQLRIEIEPSWYRLPYAFVELAADLGHRE